MRGGRFADGGLRLEAGPPADGGALRFRFEAGPAAAVGWRFEARAREDGGRMSEDAL